MHLFAQRIVHQQCSFRAPFFALERLFFSLIKRLSSNTFNTSRNLTSILHAQLIHLYLSIYLYVCLSIYLSFFLSFLSIHPSIHPSFLPFFLHSLLPFLLHFKDIQSHFTWWTSLWVHLPPLRQYNWHIPGRSKSMQSLHVKPPSFFDVLHETPKKTLKVFMKMGKHTIYIYIYILIIIYIYIHIVLCSGTQVAPPALLFASYLQYFWGPASYLLDMFSMPDFQPLIY